MFAFTPGFMPTKLAGMPVISEFECRPIDENVEGLMNNLGKGEKVMAGGWRC